MDVFVFLHVLGAVILLGNIVTAGFWKMRADRTGNPAVIHHAAETVMVADYVFTVPGILLLLLSGTLMAARAGYSLGAWSWFTLSLLLFVLTGLLWSAVLLPLQRQMIRLSARALETGAIDDAYRRASLRWNAVGIVATLLPVLILYLIVVKGF